MLENFDENYSQARPFHICAIYSLEYGMCNGLYPACKQKIITFINNNVSLKIFFFSYSINTCINISMKINS